MQPNGESACDATCAFARYPMQIKVTEIPNGGVSIEMDRATAYLFSTLAALGCHSVVGNLPGLLTLQSVLRGYMCPDGHLRVDKIYEACQTVSQCVSEV